MRLNRYGETRAELDRLAKQFPQHETLVIDGPDLETSRSYTRFVATRVVRNATIGRALARTALGAGLVIRSVTATPVIFTDFVAAEPILQMATVMGGAVDCGAVEPGAATRWLNRLRNGPFLAAFTVFTVVATKP